METINLNRLLNRTQTYEEIRDILFTMSKNNSISSKRGIYLHGNSGIGKTSFIMNLLKELNFDTIYYDGSDLRNKAAIENIADNNIGQYNVSKLLNGEQKQIVIVMDDIENMNSGDKGGINALSKLIRPKKTKKQKLELKTTNPIICICNNHVDKKIKEIMKGCFIIELPTPNIYQITRICNELNINLQGHKDKLHQINGDLRKLNLLLKNSNTNSNNFTVSQKKCKNNVDYTMQGGDESTSVETIENTTNMHKMLDNYDVKVMAYGLYRHKYSLFQHNQLINDTDRTIIGLIYHENLAHILNKLTPKNSSKLYIKILNIICYADYLDRMTFQKQIWQFNEISSILKTMYANSILHDSLSHPISYITQNDIAFTKVLTKYSTEYNNSTFFQHLAFKLNLEYYEILVYFKSIRNTIDNCLDILYTYDISEIDITRIYRYIDYIENYEIS